MWLFSVLEHILQNEKVKIPGGSFGTASQELQNIMDASGIIELVLMNTRVDYLSSTPGLTMKGTSGWNDDVDGDWI